MWVIIINDGTVLFYLGSKTVNDIMVNAKVSQNESLIELICGKVCLKDNGFFGCQED